MTCIVGMVDKGTVIMGGDSAATDADEHLRVRADRKVFVLGPFIIGFCGSFRVGQVLQYGFYPSERHPKQDVTEYMVTVFVEELRDCLFSGGTAVKENEVDTQDSQILVGYEGRLFQIDCDFQVAELTLPFDACGSGGNYALGVLYGLKDTKMSAKKKVQKALEAAEQFCGAVRGPFFIETLEQE